MEIRCECGCTVFFGYLRVGLVLQKWGRTMAYEIEDVRASQEIFYYLLEHHEMKGEAEDALYGNVIYLIPKEENNFLGFSKPQLKAVLCKSNATDKDYYLSQFVILTVLVEFFDGQGSSSKTREYIRVGELQNCISARLKEGAENAGDSEEDGIAFHDILEAYEALRSDEKGSHARTTKEGFLHQILTFLQKQGLIEYIEQDEMIMTTKKLDNFMDWNLLNQNNYQRILRVLGVAEDE